jgi:hypothetical protein
MAKLRFHTNVFAEPFHCTWDEAAFRKAAAR